LYIILGIFVIEDECFKIMKIFDIDKNDCVDDLDFLTLLESESEIIQKKTNRIRDAAIYFRSWLKLHSGHTSLTEE
jgi:hypothetical protein